jgi:hypothetical protein
MSDKTKPKKKSSLENPHVAASAIAIGLLITLLSLSARTGNDYLLITLVLLLPIILYELGGRVMEFYWTNFEKYENQNGIVLYIARILYAFTFIAVASTITFFTYETFENSYLKSKNLYDFRHKAVIELQQKLLNRFCCPGKTIPEAQIMAYLRSQLESSFMHYHTREYHQQDVNKVHRNKFIDRSVDEVLDVIEHNTGFIYNNETKTWKYEHDFAPLNVLTVRKHCLANYS